MIFTIFQSATLVYSWTHKQEVKFNNTISKNELDQSCLCTDVQHKSIKKKLCGGFGNVTIGECLFCLLGTVSIMFWAWTIY